MNSRCATRGLCSLNSALRRRGHSDASASKHRLRSLKCSRFAKKPRGTDGVRAGERARAGRELGESGEWTDGRTGGETSATCSPMTGQLSNKPGCEDYDRPHLPLRVSFERDRKNLPRTDGIINQPQQQPRRNGKGATAASASIDLISSETEQTMHASFSSSLAACNISPQIDSLILVFMLHLCRRNRGTASVSPEFRSSAAESQLCSCTDDSLFS